ncbi:MAG: hypothetical protein LUH07_14465 [Lachnospiraceae bacterium]|nr:hypothetical protein [Lachnospiraceae bacterium]
MGEKNLKRNFWVGMIVLAALIGAALCWRMIPCSFDSLLPDEQGSLRYISCTAHVPSYEDEETVYDTYRLDELTAGMEEYTAVLDILNGASYRPGFRNLIAPLVHGTVSGAQSDGRMATVTLLCEERSFSITFLGSGTMAVSIYPDGSFLVYYMIGTETYEELMAYIQGHGVSESDDAAQETSGETVSCDQQENEAAEITDSQKAEDTYLSDEERYSGMLVSREEYPELYEAAEGMLNDREAYKDQQADGIGNTVVSDSIHIFRNGLSDEVFVITATALTGLTADDEVRLSFGVRLSEDSAYGMEIVDEIEVTNDGMQERLTAFVQYIVSANESARFLRQTSDERDNDCAFCSHYIMENEEYRQALGYQLIYMDDDDYPELIISEQSEAGGFRILHYDNGTVYATQSNRLYYSYIPNGNLLLNAEGNMGLYTDDVYSIVDGQVTLIATGYRGLWAMQDGEIEWSGNNLDEDHYFWEGEELSEEEYAAVLEAVYPSEKAVECNDIPYYSYREIVALLDESYLKEIPAAKG